MASLERIPEILKNFIIFLCSILFALFVIPIFIIVISLCALYRQMVKLLAYIFKPNLCKIISPRNSPAAIDDVYKQPKNNLISVSVVRGPVCPTRIASCITKHAVEAKNCDGSIKYPEFRQYYTQWGGYRFLRCESNFHIKDHVISHDYGPIEEKRLSQIRRQILYAPFKPGTSPWEIHLIEHFKTNMSVIIFKVHHGLCDGYSCLKLFINCINSEGDLHLNMIAKPKTELSQKPEIRGYMGAVLGAPYYFLKQWVECKMQSENPFMAANLKRKCFTAATCFSVQKIKEVATRWEVSFSSVLLTLLSGGLRSFLKSEGLTVPARMLVLTPLPFPGHPEKLRNYWYVYGLKKLNNSV